MSGLRHCNPWLMCIERSIELLRLNNFNQTLPSGYVLYDFVDQKVTPVAVPNEVKTRIWEKVQDDYIDYVLKNGRDLTEKNLVLGYDLNKNITCVNRYKSDLIKWFVQNNEAVRNQLFDWLDDNYGLDKNDKNPNKYVDFRINNIINFLRKD